MTNRIKQLPGHTKSPITEAARPGDGRGYAIFNDGPTGEAHALAHRLTDAGQWLVGHRLLGDWLDSHSGQGSDWVHLQFHMAIFELALGEWDAAHRRFLEEVLPTAASSAHALTDAPALLWRLTLSAPNSVALPWEPIRQTALAHMSGTDDPFVQLHHLMALAGANDRASILRWLRTVANSTDSCVPQTLKRFAFAMLALACGSFHHAGNLLRAVLPELTAIGGSPAQNQLFIQLAAWAERKAADGLGASTTTTSDAYSSDVVSDRRNSRIRSVIHQPPRTAISVPPRSVSTHIALHSH